jgi:hypothetical protein
MSIPPVRPFYPPTSPEFPAISNPPEKKEDSLKEDPWLDKPEPRLPSGGLNYVW